MRLSDGLKQRRADLLDRLEKLAKGAEAEERLFTGEEQAEWDRVQREIADLDAKLKAQLEAEDLLRGDATGRPISGPPRLIDDHGNVIRALTLKDRLADAVPQRTVTDPGEVSTARVLRGVVLGDWGRATRLERAMGEATLAGGGYSVPSELSALWLDTARAASVCMQAGALTIPMATSTLRIARVDTDPTVMFRQEHQPITESDLVFGAVDLKARTAGILCRVSVELLEDSPIANQMIETAMAGAMGLAFDKAMLAGDGSTAGGLDNPTGLLNAAGVNSIATVGALADYNKFIDAYVAVLNANGMPNAWVLNPTQLGALAKAPTGITGDKTQLKVPVPIDGISPPYVTTGLPAGNAIVGNFNMLGLAMRTNMTLEASRTAADTMSKVEVLIRLYARIDVAILRPSHFTKLTGITLELESGGSGGGGGHRVAVRQPA
jgi:HK97 family phage major capsid protein